MENPRPEKVAVVNEVRERLDGAEAAILTEYRGLTVARAGRAAPGPRGRRRRLQGLQEHPGQAGDRRRPPRGPGAAARGADGHRLRLGRGQRRGQGAARLRPDQPQPDRQGRPPRRRLPVGPGPRPSWPTCHRATCSWPSWPVPSPHRCGSSPASSRPFPGASPTGCRPCSSRRAGRPPRPRAPAEPPAAETRAEAPPKPVAESPGRGADGTGRGRAAPSRGRTEPTHRPRPEADTAAEAPAAERPAAEAADAEAGSRRRGRGRRSAGEADAERPKRRPGTTSDIDRSSNSKEQNAQWPTKTLTKDQILDGIANLSVLELSELLKDFEEKFGVTAAAPVAVAAAPAAGGGDAGGGEEEKTEFDVVLTAAGDKKIQVIKEVRALTSLGSERGQGPGRLGPEARARAGFQGRRRQGQSPARGGRGDRRGQVAAGRGRSA